LFGGLRLRLRFWLRLGRTLSLDCVVLIH
jgi:hypothetical protein